MSENNDIIIEATLLDNGDRNSIGYIANSLEKIRLNLNHGFPKEEVDRLKKIEEDLARSWKPQYDALTKIQEHFRKMYEPFEKMKESLKEFFESLSEFTRKGWFISDDILKEYNLDELRMLVNSEDKTIGEHLIEKHGSNKSVSLMLHRISTRFPKRGSILQEIKKAYSEEMYASVVALCYSQADGICSEIWSHGFFDKDKNDFYKLKLFKNIEDSNLGISSYLVNHAGLSENEITMHSGSECLEEQVVREKTYNRHLVLHGHSLNYGIKINAFRAILLIDFITFCAEKMDAIKTEEIN